MLEKMRTMTRGRGTIMQLRGEQIYKQRDREREIQREMRGNQTEGQTIKQPGIRSVGEWNRRVLDVQREMPSFYRSDRSDKKSLSRSSIRLYDCDRWPLIDSDAACILSAINHSRG